jgi:hypothetical protein
MIGHSGVRLFFFATPMVSLAAELMLIRIAAHFSNAVAAAGLAVSFLLSSTYYSARASGLVAKSWKLFVSYEKSYFLKN